MVEEKLLAVPDTFWSDDPAIRAMARKKAARTAKQAWDRAHAKMRDAKIADVAGETTVRHDTAAGKQATASTLDPPPLPLLPHGVEPGARQHRPIVLRAARTLGPDEQPDNDSSKLPRPLPRTRT
jgi:hypothetical protein